MKRIRFTSERWILSAFIFILGTLVFTSCSDTKKLVYFDGVQDASLKIQEQNPIPVIQANDLLSIIISSLNPEASAIFNAPNESTPTTNQATGGGNNTVTVGYLVNRNGDIQFPILGQLHVEGMNKEQLTKYITQQLMDKKLLVDPIVTIRHLNYRVSVLGEVSRPGIYTAPNEKFTILEALGMAGDMTMYGKKENVLLIRETGKDEKITKRLNLNSQEILTSPFYYLRSNDVIYVEPTKDKVARERNMVLLPIIISLTTLFLVVIDRF
jgi:polysaccharide export outer membrane protein